VTRVRFAEFVRSRPGQLLAAGLLGAIIGGGVVAAVTTAWDRAHVRQVVFDEGGSRSGRVPLGPGPYFRGPDTGPFGPGSQGSCTRTDTGFRCEFSQPKPDVPTPQASPGATS
jgi:hypothetical protein